MKIPPEDLIKLFKAKNQQEQQNAAMKMLGELDDDQSRKIKDIMRDEEKLKAVLQSPEAQQLMNKLKGFKNGQH